MNSKKKEVNILKVRCWDAYSHQSCVQKTELKKRLAKKNLHFEKKERKFLLCIGKFLKCISTIFSFYFILCFTRGLIKIRQQNFIAVCWLQISLQKENILLKIVKGWKGCWDNLVNWVVSLPTMLLNFSFNLLNFGWKFCGKFFGI